ncbi:hypothetical protein OKA04_20245 [Luteolibacter flavescens]|uniref:Uncharacterized protein n=1 Tax=Luteolibacter flavescens TaxID=1859460 RepID=A0ABT3FVT0_9BACT|nr:hypothetical protein [Luteolibacter flavescens]MCW1887080.1 hypothetical protein [Luteolibacter flavescens]
MRFSSLLLIALTGTVVARPQLKKQEWYPVEQIISRADAPVGNPGSSVFAADVEISGRWLAVSESSWSESGDSSASVHLFQRTSGGARKPWQWRQEVEVDSISAFSPGAHPEFPMALRDRELMVAAPWPGGLSVYGLDRSGKWILTQSIARAFEGTVWPNGKILLSDDLLAFPNVGGSLFIFSRNAETGDWQPEREFPRGTLSNPNDFFLSENRLALIRRGNGQPAYIEFHEKTPAGTWTAGEAVELFNPGSFLVSTVNMHAAFDGEVLVVGLGNTDFLGNPTGGSILWRISREAGEWSVVDEVEIPLQSSMLAAKDGCILVHGFTPDMFGNPMFGQAAMLDRGFLQRGNIRAAAGMASLDGARFATSATRMNFLGNTSDERVTIFRNPWAGWFRRR